MLRNGKLNNIFVNVIHLVAHHLKYNYHRRRRRALARHEQCLTNFFLPPGSLLNKQQKVHKKCFKFVFSFIARRGETLHGTVVNEVAQKTALIREKTNLLSMLVERQMQTKSFDEISCFQTFH